MAHTHSITLTDIRMTNKHVYVIKERLTVQGANGVGGDILSVRRRNVREHSMESTGGSWVGCIAKCSVGKAHMYITCSVIYF